MSTAIASEVSEDFGWISHPKRRAFLQAFVLTGTVSAAAHAAQITRQTHRNWLADSSPDGEAYREAFALAKQEAADFIKAEVIRRAVRGERRYKFFQGEPLKHPITKEPYYELEKSDNLLIRVAQALLPEEFADRRIEHRTLDVTTNQKLEVAVQQLSLEQLSAVSKLLENAGEDAGVVIDVESEPKLIEGESDETT